MIRVLIVEDDKLVRNGLMTAMPWGRFDMQVVGEARHGKEALQFLASNGADCIFTDLGMPVMSGIELMKIVRRRYPAIHVVVLTLHKDFEYVQEALRLGAIDYIAKVQFEEEDYEKVLARIKRLIVLKHAEKPASSISDSDSRCFTVDAGYALLSTDEHAEIHWLDAVFRPASNPFLEVGHSVWFWAPEAESDEDSLHRAMTEAVGRRHGWTLLRLQGIEGEHRLEVYRRLGKYRKCEYFYDYREDCKAASLSIGELPCSKNALSEAELARLAERWRSCEWIHREALFMQMKSELRSLRLPPPKLFAIFYDFATAWKQNYGSIVPSSIAAPDTIACWLDAERWLQQARELVNGTSPKFQYSQEVMNCIMSAVKIVRNEINLQLYAGNVAQRVNMSRSYFNRCFKDIVGSSFNEYLRKIRVEKAKDLLLKTNQSIQWIAEQTGYMDEKYFSRVFRQQTRMTPSEFRLARSWGKPAEEK